MSDIAITQALGFASLVFTGILSYFMFRAKSASELAVIQANAASAAAIAAAAKVETVAVTAGVAANKVTALTNKVDGVQKTLEASAERRDQQLEVVVAKVDTMQVTVDSTAKTATETHVLVDGQMGVVLEIGLEAAQGRYDDNPSPENKTKLDAARKKFDEHEVKMKIVEAKNAATPEAKA